MAAPASLASVGNLSLSAVSHGDGGRQVAKISVSATPSRSFLRRARNLRNFPGTISLTARTVMHAFDTDRGFGSNTDPAYKSRKSNFSFDNDDSFSFDDDRSFNKSYGSGLENNQRFNRNQGYGFNQRSTQAQGNKLFVGNLPWSADEQRLEGVFQEAGTVELVEVVYDKVTGRSRGFAFVTMGSAEEAEAAVSKLDGYSLGGRSIKVNISSGQKGGVSARNSGAFSSGNSNAYGSSETGDSSKVFVGNLPWGVDDAALENMFNSYGEVVEARVVYDRNSGQSRGFGFVTLSSPSQASEAVSSLNGSDFDGRPLRVNLAGERPAPRF